MKKLALLFGALSLVSSVAYAKEVVPAVEEVVVVEEVAPVAAAPALTVTHVGQALIFENTSGDKADVGEAVHLANMVGLAYEDWTFDLMARKTWSVDTDNGIHSNGHRMDLDVWRNFENFSVGARWRQEADNDKWLARAKYNFGMFSGWVDAGYMFNNANDNKGNNDAVYSEAMPVALTVGPVTVGYYYEYYDFNGTGSDNGEKTKEFTQQARVMFPLYNGEKLSLGAEYRYQFAQDMEFENGNKDGWQENNRHIGIVSANYAVTDAFSLNGYYEYDWNKYEGHDGAKDKKDNYYGEFGLGWNYAF